MGDFPDGMTREAFAASRGPVGSPTPKWESVLYGPTPRFSLHHPAAPPVSYTSYASTAWSGQDSCTRAVPPAPAGLLVAQAEYGYSREWHRDTATQPCLETEQCICGQTVNPGTPQFGHIDDVTRSHREIRGATAALQLKNHYQAMGPSAGWGAPAFLDPHPYFEADYYCTGDNTGLNLPSGGFAGISSHLQPVLLQEPAIQYAGGLDDATLGSSDARALSTQSRDSSSNSSSVSADGDSWAGGVVDLEPPPAPPAHFRLSHRSRPSAATTERPEDRLLRLYQALADGTAEPGLLGQRSSNLSSQGASVEVSHSLTADVQKPSPSGSASSSKKRARRGSLPDTVLSIAAANQDISQDIGRDGRRSPARNGKTPRNLEMARPANGHFGALEWRPGMSRYSCIYFNVNYWTVVIKRERRRFHTLQEAEAHFEHVCYLQGVSPDLKLRPGWAATPNN